MIVILLTIIYRMGTRIEAISPLLQYVISKIHIRTHNIFFKNYFATHEEYPYYINNEDERKPAKSTLFLKINYPG